MVSKSGKMGQSMMDSGKETKPMVRELLFMLMETSMKDNGLMIKPMDMELISMPMEQHMLENLEMAKNQAKEFLIAGSMVQPIKEIFIMAKSMALVFIIILMAIHMKVSGLKV